MHRRDHGGDNRGVVEKTTEKGYREGNPCLGRTNGLGIAKQVVHQQIDTAGMMNARSHHKHGNHGDQTTVAEPGERLVRGHNPAGTEHHEHTHHHQMGRKSPCTHQYQRGACEAQRKPALPVHQRFFPIRKLAG